MPSSPLQLIRGLSRAAALIGAVVVAVAALGADEKDGSDVARSQPVITDAQWIWAMPSAEKQVVHPLRLEGRVNYYDWRWKMLWLQQGDICTYVQLATARPEPALKGGEHILLEGTIVPVRGIEFDRVKVTVVRNLEPVEPLATAGHINNMAAYHSHIVTAEAYVDGQSLIDDDHLRLEMIAENRPVIAWVKPDDPAALPDWRGKFVRVTGLYSGRVDPTGTETSIEIYVSRQADVTVTGTIEANGLFERRFAWINELPQLPVGTEVRVRGRVESHKAGAVMIVRDETGEVQLHSIQRQRLAVGAAVEAVGRVAVAGGRWVLDAALYRHDQNAAPGGPWTATPGGLTTIAEIRQLTGEEAAQHRPVSVSGMVTWAPPAGSNYFYLQDVNAGIRVAFDPASMPVPEWLKYLHVEGVTAAGGEVPVIELRRFDDLGAMSPPDPKPVTYEQVIGGREDGNWVEVHGFVQRIDSDGERRRIRVTTPSGEFVGLLDSPVNFQANPGSLVRMHGVCETTVGRDGRIDGVTLRVPFIHDLYVEEDAPVDLFDLPLRSLKSISQLSGGTEMMRVRVAGTVIHAARGQFVYLEDDGAGLLLLSRDVAQLQPGDRIEAVGILGREGVRTILREATFRRIAGGPAPVPVVLANPGQISLPLDSRLVRVRGTLIDTFRRPGLVRLTLQAGRTMFDATLEGDHPTLPATMGEGLELTGVCRIVFDDSREQRGFQLHLRSPADVLVVEPAKFWTLEHALMACAVLGGLTLLGLGWITALRRRVSRQTALIRSQMEHQARLEADVQRAARLESLGTLAGGIAHDFNNLLTIILANSGLAMTEASPEMAGCLREIERGARRARELTQQLLTFAEGGAPLRSSVDLSALVREATEPVLRGTGVRAEYDCPAGLWRAYADPEQFAQAIRKLALNAVEAMPQGGVLRLALQNERIAAGAELGLQPGRYVRLTVADTGTGISPEVLPRIFDPYFSTRKEGAGLGLATVYSIVRRHQGRIEARSEPGQGATFHLWLPASEDATPPIPLKTGSEADASAPPGSPEPPAAPVPGKPAEPPRAAGAAPVASAPATERPPPRVLVMDDEESVRRVMDIVLKRMGIEPLVVADGAAALRAFGEAQAAGRPVDLLVLDLTVPGGMGGRRVIEEIRRGGATTPAIVASGYSNDPVLSKFADYGFQAMLVKPFDIHSIREAVGRFITVKPRR
ncbi:MAG TPA: ATP-binding protein [Opitutus sp.]|nr:ATP-binding protein [Opitutus sp.]